MGPVRAVLLSGKSFTLPAAAVTLYLQLWIDLVAVNLRIPYSSDPACVLEEFVVGTDPSPHVTVRLVVYKVSAPAHVDPIPQS